MTAALITHLNNERLRRGWSAKTWADFAGVHPQTAQKIIRGEARGSVWAVQRMARALQLELWVRPQHGAHDG